MEKQDKQETKLFSEWDSDVDCNDCEHYWDNSCDGATPKRLRRPCNSFLATRKVFIPEQIKALENRCESLKCSCITLSICVILLALYNILEVIL